MDEMVLQAMAKWPQVRACRGWLGLDGRGDWYLRDDAAQAAGPFRTPDQGAGTPAARGSRLTHDKLIAFIGRNYAPDELGQWFFQNGPQRVYVELQFAPWVWRVTDLGAITVRSHTGVDSPVLSTLLDDSGHVYLETEMGFGLVHSQDVWQAAQAIEAGVFPSPQNVRRAELPHRYGYVLSPAEWALQPAPSGGNRP